MQDDLTFTSRRSPVICVHGCVASSQPLASNIGLDILKRGGNAADSAVAMAAALAVTEPCSTGIGGDSFCLFYDANTRQVHGLNGSGRAPGAQTLDLLEGRGFSESNPIPSFHALNVTVPGAAACWCDTVRLFGSQKLSLQDVLGPATDLALRGFPVAEVTAHNWAKWNHRMREAGRELGGDFLMKNKAPKHGQLFLNPHLAQTFQELGQHGKAGFYEGKVAKAIVDVIVQNGGVMSLEDLRSHESQEIKPIHTDYRGVRLWEVPPNGQGMAALMALNILENFPIKKMGHNSAMYLHVLAEALKLSLAETFQYCADPNHVNVPLEDLLSKTHSLQLSHAIHMDRASVVAEHGVTKGSDTVYFTVVDGQGNACSFVNSNYMGFGTGLVPQSCGFSLHNRGASFSLDRRHGNCWVPGKRPYHTIIPALLTDPVSGRLLCSLGVMGAFMQPQGHVQVLLNILEFGMNPQQALDAPRMYVQRDDDAQQWCVNLEQGVDQDVAENLEKRSHVVRWPITGHDRCQFGRGQIISVGDWWNLSTYEAEPTVRVLWAGSDPRARDYGRGRQPKQWRGRGQGRIPERLSQLVWYMMGVGGGGVLMFLPAGVFISLGKCTGCCWNESFMMCGSVMAALVGLAGSGYCFVVSGMAMLEGPQCFTSMGWSYPFADLRGSYLLEKEKWSTCLQPVNIVEWNVTLLCILLCLSGLEFLICILQLISGLVTAVCRPCCYKQDYTLNA
ncbi:hypothetical protein UPYG_G00033530 [Umbra pygmaea]|uniref:Gamma-glutamyltransferase YwrD n=1 Tax=Umbra pygmaea TaxID=75934 RepID=A0ABD0XNB0_UMBPY